MTITTAPDPLEAVEYAGWHLAAEPIEERMEALLNVVRQAMGLPVTGPLPELPDVGAPAEEARGKPETKPEPKHALALVRASEAPEDAAGARKDARLGRQQAFEPESGAVPDFTGTGDAATVADATKEDPGLAAAVLVPAEVIAAETYPDGTKTKACRGELCRGRQRPVTEFTKDGSKRGDGLRYRCRACEAKARREARIRTQRQKPQKQQRPTPAPAA